VIETYSRRARLCSCLALVAFFLPLSAMGEVITREDAIQIVVERMIDPTTLDHDVMAFLTMKPLEAGDEVAPLGFPEETETVSAPTWFAWIDDEPDAEFGHATRFVFIAADTGETRVLEKEWGPVLNDVQVLWRNLEDWEEARGLIFAHPPIEQGEGPPPAEQP
jgi:hypothetical protein